MQQIDKKIPDVTMEVYITTVGVKSQNTPHLLLQFNAEKLTLPSGSAIKGLEAYQLQVTRDEFFKNALVEGGMPNRPVSRRNGDVFEIPFIHSGSSKPSSKPPFDDGLVARFTVYENKTTEIQIQTLRSKKTELAMNPPLVFSLRAGHVFVLRNPKASPDNDALLLFWIRPKPSDNPN